jgi:DNA-binding Lrp family transcriptional regulator
VLYFDLEMNTVAFGLRSTTWLWMSVAPSQLAAAGEALTKFPEVAYAAATTGPANLAICAVCRDEAEFYEFLTAKAGSLPGVERVETAPVIRTVKQATAAVVPRKLFSRTIQGDSPRPTMTPQSPAPGPPSPPTRSKT